MNKKGSYKYPSGHSKRLMKARKEKLLKAQLGSFEKYCTSNSTLKNSLTGKLQPSDLVTNDINEVNASSSKYCAVKVLEISPNLKTVGANAADILSVNYEHKCIESNAKETASTAVNIAIETEANTTDISAVNSDKKCIESNGIKTEANTSSDTLVNLNSDKKRIESNAVEIELNAVSFPNLVDCDTVKSNAVEADVDVISPLFTNENTTDFAIGDPAKWNFITEKLKEYCVENPPEQHLELLNLTERTIGNTKRFLNENNFYRTMKSGEKLKRDWLILSPSNYSIYCYVCKLFSNNSSSALATTGFCDWKHTSERLTEHENSVSHRQAVCSLAARMKVSQRIDSQLINQYDTECKYWQSILIRVVAVVKYLAKRGLSFFGDNETIGSPQNGNFLGCLELISEFDPILARHLENFGNPGKGHVNYLSSSTINEFVSLMANKVSSNIIKQIQEAKYFSIIVDSTPDIAHVDQLSLVVRYVDSTLKPVERFLTFIPIENHTSEYLANLIISTLENYGLNFMDIRGQSYDNASNMSGKYSGVQARIKEVNPLAEYVPCSAHTLNLVAMHSIENSCTEVTAFFSLLQELYNFFSASTRRWNFLKDSCKTPSFTLKSHSSTRWCADACATKSLRSNFSGIVNALNLLSESSNESALTRHEASSLSSKLQKMETVINTVVWDTILQRLNKSSKQLQSVSGSLESVLLLFNSLIIFIQHVRDNFGDYEEEAKLLNKNAEYQFSRKRKIPKKFLDDGDTPSVDFSPRNNFKVNCHYALCDALISQLISRKISYENILQKFSFLINSEETELKTKACALQKHYSSDLDDDFSEEFIQFLPIKQKEESVLDSLENLKKLNMRATFPNVEAAFKLFLTLPISNCTSERSFSLLKRLKSPLRSTLKEEKLSALAILSFENDITSNLDYSDIIHEFANQKIRKKPINSCGVI